MFLTRLRRWPEHPGLRAAESPGDRAGGHRPAPIGGGPQGLEAPTERGPPAVRARHHGLLEPPSQAEGFAEPDRIVRVGGVHGAGRGDE